MRKRTGDAGTCTSPPTSSSWLNLIERWFKELTDKRLRRGRFTSVDDLTDAITTWAEHWNIDPKPFIWKATAQDIIAKVQRGRETLHQIKSATDPLASRLQGTPTPSPLDVVTFEGFSARRVTTHFNDADELYHSSLSAGADILIIMDESTNPKMAELITVLRDRALASGMSDDGADELVGKILADSTQKVAPDVVKALMRTSGRMLREHRRINRGFKRRTRRFWGEALDLMYMTICDTIELGDDFKDRDHPDEHLVSAFIHLLARAGRVGLEVHALLCEGFPLGALARSRTLYEISVVAAVLAAYDGTPGHEDLAERYNLHHAVINRVDARIYQRDCEALGLQPLTDGDMAFIEQRREELVSRFGKPYLELTGWAYPLIKNPTGGIGDLEQLVDLRHLRGYYRWASHEVHADSKSPMLNQLTRGDQIYILAGRTNVAFEDPASLAMESLQRVTESVFTSRYANPADLLPVASLQLVVEKANDAFIAAGQTVDAREARFQARSERKRPGRGRPFKAPS